MINKKKDVFLLILVSVDKLYKEELKKNYSLLQAHHTIEHLKCSQEEDMINKLIYGHWGY